MNIGEFIHALKYNDWWINKVVENQDMPDPRYKAEIITGSEQDPIRMKVHDLATAEVDKFGK